MSRRRLFAALTAVALLTACEGSPPATPRQPAASPVPTNPPVAPLDSSVQVFPHGPALVNGSLALVVQRPDGSALPGASVWLEGPTPAWGTTSATGSLYLAPLATGSYQIRLEADGYASRHKLMVILDPSASGGTATAAQISVVMAASGGAIAGRVVRQSVPVAGAQVSIGDASTLTGDDGTFTLRGAPQGSVPLTVTALRGGPMQRTLEVGPGDQNVGDLALTPTLAVVSLENPDAPFQESSGGVQKVRDALSGLRDAVVAAGFDWQEGKADAAVRLLVCPRGLDDAAIEAYRRYVEGGGRLVLLGEWGGSAYYDPMVLNRLAGVFGLGFYPDLLRSTANALHPGWVPFQTFIPSALASKQAASVELFEACSVFAPPSAESLLTLGAGGYRIAAADPAVLAGAALRYGAGQVIALGDTSAWTSALVSGTSATFLERASNRAFLLGALGR